jgi:hypothetical protein
MRSGSSRYSKRVVILAAWFVAASGGMLRATADAPTPDPPDGPTRDVNQLLQGMRSTAGHFDPRVSTFYIQCRQECEVFDQSGRPIPARSYWNEVEYARKKDMVFCHSKLKQQSDSNPNEEWNVWRDRVTAQRKLDGIQIYPNLLPQCYNRSIYTENLFMDCYQDLEFTSPSDTEFDPNIKRPSDAHFNTLPRMVEENLAKYQLRPRLESIDGFPCHVLEWPGIDIIWLDAAHGFVARKRQFSFDPEHLAYIWLNQDLEEYAPGLWLPKKQVTYRYTSPNEPLVDGPPKLKSRYITRLAKADFTPKGDDFFKVPIADNEKLIVADLVRHITYWKHPKGTDPIQNVLDEVSTRPPSRLWSYWLLINGIIIGLVVVAALAHKLRTAGLKS